MFALRADRQVHRYGVITLALLAAALLVAEVQPPRFWDYLLFNQRGAILERAIRRGTANVVLCRLHYRLEHFTPRDALVPGQPGDSTPPR